MSESDVTRSALDAYTAGRLTRRQFLQRVAAVGVSATFASTLLAACGDDAAETTTTAAASTTAATSTTAAGGPVKGGRFIEGYDLDFNAVDPVRTANADPTFNALYEPLVTKDPEGKIVPFLASKFELGDSESVITLPADRKFQSGAAVTAEIVAEDLNMFRDPEVGQNAGFWGAVSGVRAEGDDKVILEMAHPSAAFGNILASEYSYILNPRKREEVGPENFGSQVTDGTGPYTLKTYTPGREVVVARWDDYPGCSAPFIENPGTAYLDEVQWVPIVEASQRAAEISTGNVHAVKNVPTQDLASLEANSDLVVLEFPAHFNYFIVPKLDRSQFGFDDLKVRQAISHAIDREAIVQSLLQGHGAATYGPVQPGNAYYDSGVEAFNQYDPELAARLLDEAGWVREGSGIRSKNGQQLSFACPMQTATLKNQIAEAVVGMLAEVGIEMKIEFMEQAAFREIRQDVECVFDHWLWATPIDVIGWKINFYQPPEGNEVRDGAMARVDAWSSAPDAAALQAAASDVQLYVAEQLPIIPVLTPNALWIHHKSVHGWRPNQHNLYPFYHDVWLEQG